VHDSKLIIITHEWPPFRGGAAVYCEELGAALRRTGCEVDVWKPKRPGSLRLRHLLPFAWQIWRRRAELRQRPVLLGSIGAHWIFMWLRPDCPRLFSLLHGSELLHCGQKLKRYLPHFRAVFVPSAFTKSLVPDTVETIIATPAASTAAVRAAPVAKHSDGRLRILTLARLHPRKGQLDVARALAPLQADAVYQIGGVGNATYQREVERTCHAGGVKFEYLGEVPPEKLAETYAQCDIFAMTSRTLPRSVEGFGIAYLEAGWHGKPVVGYCTGGAAEAVLDGQTGLLVDEGNVPALTEAFRRLIADPALRQRLGEGGRKHAAKFCWDATARIISAKLSSG
jgi:phosphatidyl-myo-inositol dimannoside synthase